MSKCDLHIHSRYSARSRNGCSVAWTFPTATPIRVSYIENYSSRGMDFVTITDHDTIEGCLQIVHLPQSFISEQITTYFPQDPCKIHILAWGMSEAQHEEIVTVRDNVYELQKYLAAAQIAHAVAHPLYSINGQLAASHLERLILLFKHFEAVNGLRDALLSELAQNLFGSLTREKIDKLVDRHNLVLHAS